jgi:hypothetical protein
VCLQKKAGPKGKQSKTTKKVITPLSQGFFALSTLARSMLTRLPQFIINAQQPASDKIFDTAAFEKFLQDKIKVDGRVGNLGDNIKIQQAGEGKIEIIAHNELSGRYLKYL